jgi:hypothetical protein
MKGAGIERFLDGRPIRLAGQTQCASHRRSNELAATPARALAAAAERRHRHVNERRVPGFERRARDALVGEPVRARAVDQKVGVRDADGVDRAAPYLDTERGQKPAERPLGHVGAGKRHGTLKRSHARTLCRNP